MSLSRRIRACLYSFGYMFPVLGNFVPPGHEAWNWWSSGHPNSAVASRQELEYQELTKCLVPEDGDLVENAGTGLTSGLLRLEPFKELPTHFHPEPFVETYYFTRGSGYVILDEYTNRERRQEILPGLHVNIPGRTLHGIEVGSEGCEFVWTFPARQWKDIPYIFVDPQLANLNVATNFQMPFPVGVRDSAAWEGLRRNATQWYAKVGPRDREL